MKKEIYKCIQITQDEKKSAVSLVREVKKGDPPMQIVIMNPDPNYGSLFEIGRSYQVEISPVQ